MLMQTIEQPMVGAPYWKMTKAQYLRLADEGFFGPDRRVELVFKDRRVYAGFRATTVGGARSICRGFLG